MGEVRNRGSERCKVQAARGRRLRVQCDLDRRTNEMTSRHYQARLRAMEASRGARARSESIYEIRGFGRPDYRRFTVTIWSPYTLMAHMEGLPQWFETVIRLSQTLQAIQVPSVRIIRATGC